METNAPGFLTDIIATKKCSQVELSPNKVWLAATRTYSGPDRGAIWTDSDSNTCLVIRNVEDGDLGHGFIYWQDPSVKILRIAWSPDSRFLVVVCTATNGHQPWAFLTFIVDTKDDTLHNTDPLGTILSKDISFTPSGVLRLSVGDPSAPVQFDYDLVKHIGDLPVAVKLLPEYQL